MKALIWQGEKDIRYETVPDPQIEHPRDAVIKVSSCAICGSDLHLFDSFMPGMASGELLGEVVEVGRDNAAVLGLSSRSTAKSVSAANSCDTGATLSFAKYGP